MRADRLLRLLMLLQRHRRVTAGWLAGELEVSERTVLRDMEALSAAGVPVYTERGRGGGCVLLEGFTTEVSGLTRPEAQALFAWASRESVSQLGLGAALTSALAKVAATAPTSAIAGAEALGQVVHADRRRWFAESDEVPWLPLLREATTRARQVEITYASAGAGAPSKRVVDPAGLVDNSGHWYLVAEHDGSPRTYRVSRVQHAEMLETPSARRDLRPVAEIWDELRGGFEGRLDRVEILVSVDPDHADTQRRLLGMQHSPGTPILTEPSPDGRLWWRLTVRQPQVVAAMAVMAAPHLTVVEPAWLREDVRRAALRALEHYPG